MTNQHRALFAQPLNHTATDFTRRFFDVKKPSFDGFFTGALGWIRTTIPRLRSPVHDPLCYKGRCDRLALFQAFINSVHPIHVYAREKPCELLLIVDW